MDHFLRLGRAGEMAHDCDARISVRTNTQLHRQPLGGSSCAVRDVDEVRLVAFEVINRFK